MMESPVQVIMILQKHENNITARRWLKDPKAIDLILESHIAWNEDHLKTGHPEMVLNLEENIEDYLYTPQKIDQYLTNEKEQPE